MKDHIQIEFQHITSEQSDILLAQLSSIGFEGFEEEENSLKAFILTNDFNEESLNEIATFNQLEYSKTELKETNWNAVWESNFQPVIVDEFVGIRADFHEPIMGVEHEILVTPKMSFGTGHHATTYMMIQQMKGIDFKNKSVFDFGTGTGVLAILAEKLGASNILAVDNDEWSISNTAENLERNKCRNIQLQKADDAGSGNIFDIILANINKNVIVDNLEVLSKQLAPDGVLLLSGLLSTDEADILTATLEFQLFFNEKTERNNWIALKFTS